MYKLKNITKEKLAQALNDCHLSIGEILSVEFYEPDPDDDDHTSYAGLLMAHVISPSNKKQTYVFSRHGIQNIISTNTFLVLEGNDYNCYKECPETIRLTHSLYLAITREYGRNFTSLENKYRAATRKQINDKYQQDRLRLERARRSERYKIAMEAKAIRETSEKGEPIPKQRYNDLLSRAKEFQKLPPLPPKHHPEVTYHKNISGRLNKIAKQVELESLSINQEEQQ